MDIWLHFVWELVITKVIVLKYIWTNMNSADFLAKPTGRCTIRRSLAAIGVVSPPEGSAHCLPTQSTPGCWITSADQENNERSVKRNRRVTLKETNKANCGKTDKAKELRQMEQSHKMNLSLASRISTHHHSNRTVLTRISGNTNKQNKDKVHNKNSWKLGLQSVLWASDQKRLHAQFI
jgi:hypothetical protein